MADRITKEKRSWRHKYSRHYKGPDSNRGYWLPKIDKNVERDKKNIRLLRKGGWKVIVLWEHSISTDTDIKRFMKVLE